MDALRELALSYMDQTVWCGLERPPPSFEEVYHHAADGLGHLVLKKLNLSVRDLLA